MGDERHNGARYLLNFIPGVLHLWFGYLAGTEEEAWMEWSKNHTSQRGKGGGGNSIVDFARQLRTRWGGTTDSIFVSWDGPSKTSVDRSSEIADEYLRCILHEK